MQRLISPFPRPDHPPLRMSSLSPSSVLHLGLVALAGFTSSHYSLPI